MLPPGDSSGILIAVISASVFTLAILLVVRSRQARTEIETPLTVAAFASDWLPMAPGLFGNVLVERQGPGLGLLASVGLHLFVLLGAPLLPYLFPARLHFDPSRYQVKVIEFRVPSPLVYTAGEAPRPPRRPAISRTEEAVQARREAAPPAPRHLRRFRLAASPQARTRDIVIQPDVAPEIHNTVPQRLPATFLWAQAPAPPRESQVVGAPPSQLHVRPVFSMPQAVPRVQRPNLELNIADLQIAAGPILTFHAPNLPVSVANVAPLSAAGPPAPGELPPAPLPLGDPINLIALTEKLSPYMPGYLVEIGNRLAELHSSGAGGSGEGTRDGGPEAGSAETAARAAVAGSRGGGSGGAGNTPAARATATHAELLAGAATSPGDSSAASPAAGSSADGMPRGHLGVVVVQQSSQESALEGAELLSGEPIYTVFFDVPGSPRRWMLQYCVPGAEAAPSIIQPSEGRVQIVPRRSVQPPYPLDRIPVDLKGFHGGAKRLVLYAFVTEKGETQNLRVVHGAGRQIDQEALATLRRWAFRPAVRGDTPVAVEALFGIPLQ
jgi:hypothetical protein